MPQPISRSGSALDFEDKDVRTFLGKVKKGACSRVSFPHRRRGAQYTKGEVDERVQGNRSSFRGQGDQEGKVLVSRDVLFRRNGLLSMINV